MTSVPKNPFEMGVASDEEALDRARSCLMKGMHLLNEVSVRMKACSEQLSQRQIVFDEALEWDLQLKLDDAVSHRESSVKEVEGISQQYHSLMLQYTEKVSQLEIARSSKDVSIKLLDEELVVAKLLMLEKDA
ncbi:unnamed protein product [Lactuca virosa]|uniref:RING-type E3 ubiquitin transferase n=1 Tax=Lactuca virosa TaxID=75947 RepID=A0AAU9P632_9ASTR|nr:unnamed protein product [Lactuca virosa]